MTMKFRNYKEKSPVIILWISWDQERPHFGQLEVFRSYLLIYFRLICGCVGREWLDSTFSIEPESKKKEKKRCLQLTLELCRPRSKSEKQRIPTAKVPRSKRKAMTATSSECQVRKESHGKQINILKTVRVARVVS